MPTEEPTPQALESLNAELAPYTEERFARAAKKLNEIAEQLSVMPADTGEHFFATQETHNVTLIDYINETAAEQERQKLDELKAELMVFPGKTDKHSDESPNLNFIYPVPVGCTWCASYLQELQDLEERRIKEESLKAAQDPQLQELQACIDALVIDYPGPGEIESLWKRINRTKGQNLPKHLRKGWIQNNNRRH